MTTTMTPRQRWHALLAGKSTDRIPTDYQATDEVTARLLWDLGCPDEESLWRKLRIDRRRFVEPKWKRAHHPDDPQADMWGIRYRKADYGSRVIFHGSIDNQQTLAFGSVDDVVGEVQESVAIYASARWICAPCHNLQPVSPTANIVAMYATIRELGARG